MLANTFSTNRAAACMSLALTLFTARTGHAQYYNTESGRSGRVEDATPIERRAISLDLANIQTERLNGGTQRYRFNPGFEIGMFPRTEFGLRVPISVVVPPVSTGAARVAGIGGVALSAMHSFTVESQTLPALAIAGEVLVPAGALASPRASYLLKGLATQRFGAYRVHLNAGGGTYSVQLPTSASTLCNDEASTRAGSPFSGNCDDPPIIVDLPCSVESADAPTISKSVSPSPLVAPNDFPMTQSSAIGTTPQAFGRRWFSGIGVDRAFGVASTLVSADYVIDQFTGLFNKVDQTSEIGIRLQTSATTVFNAGLAWHFGGVVPSVAFSAGMSIELAWPLIPRAPAR